MASNWPVDAASRASRPVRTAVTRKPLRVRPVSSIRRIDRSSSATRMWGWVDIGILVLGFCSGWEARAGRNPDGKSRALVQLAFQGDRAAMQLGDFANQRQAQAGAGRAGILYARHAIEFVEHALQVGGGNAVALIGHFDDDPILAGARVRQILS